MFYYQADFSFFVFLFLCPPLISVCSIPILILCLCTDLPSGSPAGLHTRYHLMKQRIICAWGSNTEKEQDEHMSMTSNCIASNTFSLQTRSHFFPSPVFFSTSFFLSSSLYPVRYLQPFLPPNPLMALAEKPVWEVHWRIKRTLTSNLEKEVEKMSGGNREVEMRERERKRDLGLLGAGGKENPTVKIKQL